MKRINLSKQFEYLENPERIRKRNVARKLRRLDSPLFSFDEQFIEEGFFEND